MSSPRSYLPHSTEQDAKTQEPLAFVSASLLLLLLNSLGVAVAVVVTGVGVVPPPPLSLLEPIEGTCSNFAFNLSEIGQRPGLPPIVVSVRSLK